MIDKTRNILVELYIGCEEDFIKGLQIFEQIVENQIKQTSDIQISNLKKSLKETLEETDLSPDPESSSSSNNDLNPNPNPNPDLNLNPNPNPDPNSSNSTTQPNPEQIDTSMSDAEPKIPPSPEENPSTNEGSNNQPPIQGLQNQPLLQGLQNQPHIDGSQINPSGAINSESQPPILTKEVINVNENKIIPQLDNNSTDNLPGNSQVNEVNTQ